MIIVRYARLWFGLGMSFMALALLSILIFNLNLAPDFTGGDVFEIRFEQDTSSEELRELFASGDHPQPSLVSPLDDTRYRLEFPPLDNAEEVTDVLQDTYEEEDSFQVEAQRRISPVIGSELLNRSVIALGVVIVGIIVFITYVFRRVSYPVPSIYYGLAAIIALAHDILIPVGIFALLSSMGLLTIDLLFIVALLSILGTSVNDTIVVFDRIRENVDLDEKNDFETIVGNSIQQTVMRSISTSFTLLVVLGAIFAFGGASVQYFALALFIGVLFGTYSSLFIASPFILFIYRNRKGKEDQTVSAPAES